MEWGFIDMPVKLKVVKPFTYLVNGQQCPYLVNGQHCGHLSRASPKFSWQYLLWRSILTLHI